jgi:N-acetylglucosamine kinase-like BadF-type ATPase
LGIDGGGTKTDAWLAEADPGGDIRVVGRGRSGPGNPRSIGYAEAFANVEAAIQSAFQEAARDRHEADAACMALAGCDRRSEREKIHSWAREQRIARRLRLTNDAEPILTQGTPDGHGVALIAGTGSFAFGRNPQGETVRVGGWGFRFGDEGSGYAIAVAGLRAAARVADGRGPDTSLLTRFQRKVNVSNPLGLIEALYQAEVTQQTVADLAPVVLQAATAGDKVAMDLVAGAAADLAEMVATVVRRLALPPIGLPLALAGSFLLKSDLLQTRFLRQLQHFRGIECRTEAVRQPVYGAVVIANSLNEPGTA